MQKRKETTARLELNNTPRYDITGERYGNTLSDDMFSLKSPSYGKHTPESYDYFTRGGYWDDFAADEAATYPLPSGLSNLGVPSTTFSSAPSDYGNNHGIISRKAYTDYEAPGGVYVDTDSSVYDGTSMEDIMGEYHKLLAEKRGREDLRNGIRRDSLYEKSGGRTFHDKGDQWLRDDAEMDPAVGELVNYGMLSPAQLEQLVKMGVNRHESEDLMAYINLYRDYLENGI